MWARRGLGMVLNGKNWVLAVLDPFDGPVVEVKVGDLKRLRARNARRLSPHCESVVLRRDKYLSCSNIANWMIATPMAVWQLHRLPAHCETEQLVTETDPEDGQLPVGERPNCIDRVTDGRGVAGSVRQENAIGFEGSHLLGRSRRRDDGDAATVSHEQAQNVAL